MVVWIATANSLADTLTGYTSPPLFTQDPQWRTDFNTFLAMAKAVTGSMTITEESPCPHKLNQVRRS